MAQITQIKLKFEFHVLLFVLGHTHAKIYRRGQFVIMEKVWFVKEQCSAFAQRITSLLQVSDDHIHKMVLATPAGKVKTIPS